MGLSMTGVEVNNKGHTYYQMKCDDCGALKLIRKDRMSQNLKCNALRHTRPDLSQLLADDEDEFRYSIHSGLIAKWKCPRCGAIFTKRVEDAVEKGINCVRCGEKTSYPNRYMFALLSQLNIQFEREKIFFWSNNKRYDFYIPDREVIIEIHGLQHYENCNYYTEYQLIYKNDLLKEQCAKENGIKYYICIDARISNFKYITENVYQSDLVKMFDFSKVDWIQLEKDIQSGIFYKIVDMWNNNYIISDISSKLKLSNDTIIEILKRATEIGICEYNAIKQSKKWLNVSHEGNKKKVICINKGKIFSSINDAAKHYNISPKALSNCLVGRSNSCGRDKKTNKKLYWNYMED